MKILIFIVLNVVFTQTIALETETIYRPPTLEELVNIDIARFDVRNGKDGELFSQWMCIFVTYCLKWSNLNILIIILGCGIPSKEDREEFSTAQVQGDITSPVQVNQILKKMTQIN